MYDVVTFGEAMVRLASPGHTRLEQATCLEMTVGGGEFNVAVNCAGLGLKSAWVSRLVDNWSGRLIRNKGREHGVDMSHIVWTQFDGVGFERNGFYHLETGVGPRRTTGGIRLFRISNRARWTGRGCSRTRDGFM
jgi:2-dehydro-3-deoxygluconokinase